ncbi:MAG: SpoIIE family protein phosphatase [Actinobacteria bacterium]|nr:SpoIIE family protein phosphatase [Actinomycetota bacterium]
MADAADIQRAGEGVDELEKTLKSVREDSEVAHVLLSLAGVLAEVGPVEATLEKAVRVSAEIMRADRAFAVTVGAGDRLEIRAHVGFDADGFDLLRQRTSSPGGLGLLRSAISEREPLLIDDAVNDPRVEPDEAHKYGVRGFVGIPLSRWGEDFGGIALEYTHPKTFSARDVSLVQGISRQIGVAIVNARRFNLMSGLRAFGLTLASRLSLTSVVDQVVWGAVSLLGGDVAGVYFLDATNRALVASGGLDPDDDLGERFARIDLEVDPWRALTQGRPVVVRDLDNAPAQLHAVAAPIPGEDSPMLGAVVVFFQRPLGVGPDEMEALSVLAGQAGMAIENANRFERQRRVARSLQAGLLSTEMPQLENFEVAAVYEPASGEADVGGDFFDVYSLGNERYAVVVGDVSGKGAEAAARTAMAKYMLRAFTIRNPNPASALYYLNNALAHDLEADRFATLVYGVFDSGSRRWTIARGGHPPPLLYRASTGKVTAYEELIGSILGAFEDMEFEEGSFVMEPGDVFLIYTDGLIETRNDEGLFYGRRRIEEMLKRFASELSPPDLTLRMYQDAQQFGVVSDDTVIFAMRCVG